MAERKKLDAVADFLKHHAVDLKKSKGPTEEELLEDPAFFSWIAQKEAREAGELLCKLANIPTPCREQFLDEVATIFAPLGWCIWYSTKCPPEFQKIVEAIETGVRTAYSNLLVLPRRARFLGGKPFERHLRDMVLVCANITGADPHVVASVGRRGRRKQARTRTSYQLRLFIWKIARAVKRHGGKNLTLDRERKRGTWIDALDGLRPLLRKGFIPRVVPLSMIEELQRKSNKKPLPS